jgi:signal transduction histidine kinase
MISRDTVLGVLLVDNFITKRPISDDDLGRLRVFANTAALSFERSRLRASLEVKLQELTAANRELKESRDKLVRTERLSAVGEVAASVAHEIRNPLTAIGGFARSVLNSLTPDDRNRTRLQIIVDEVRRLENILTEILQFTRPTMPRFEATDLNGIILQTFGMMSQEIDEESITVHKRLDPNLPAVWADSDQVRQVLLNLFRNAIHAMPDGGELWVETNVQGDQIELKVEDSGIGIPKANREKLFDAFFSTKSSGSGLGLTVSLQIARNHGGTIVVDSEEGKGSTFTVHFPLKKKST